MIAASRIVDTAFYMASIIAIGAVSGVVCALTLAAIIKRTGIHQRIEELIFHAESELREAQEDD